MVRQVARYTLFVDASERNASMVFDWRKVDRSPWRHNDLVALASSYSGWEYADTIPEYSLFRSDSSFFRGSHCWELRASPTPSFKQSDPNIGGAYSSLLSVMQATTVAPLLNWTCAGTRRIYTSYVIGVSTAYFGAGVGGDLQQLTTLGQVTVEGAFSTLLSRMASHGFQMVKLQKQRGGVQLSPAIAHDVLSVNIQNRICGNQRRRSRRALNVL